jgi:hypothetical protein
MVGVIDRQNDRRAKVSGQWVLKKFALSGLITPSHRFHSNLFKKACETEFSYISHYSPWL